MRNIFALNAAVVFISGLLSGQSTSTITGQVRDSTEAAIPGVRVVVRAVETGVEYPARTNAEGYYTVSFLPPVEYQVSAELEGFRKANSEVFKLDASSITRVNLAMHPKDAKEVVEITATAPIIDTQDSAVGMTVPENELNSLPLNGRNTLELALTIPGVGGEAGSDEGGMYATVPGTGSGLILGGGRSGTSAILADGSNSTSVALGRATVTFSPDTIQEIRVITSTFSAQYGVSGGGVISTISKSGTNELHGSAYWFTRNPALQARTFNTILPPSQKRQELGTTWSGPVWIPKVYRGRNRTFFFFSFEPKRWTDAAAQYTRVPTTEERQGDFRNSYAAPGAKFPLLYQQVRCAPSEADCRQLVAINRATNSTPYALFNAGDPELAGRVIPKQYLDPVAQDLLKDVPLPNMPYDSSGNNYSGAKGVIGQDNRWNIKIDHNVSASNRLSVRYSDIPNVADRYRYEKSNLFMSNPTDRSVTRQVLLSDTHTFGSRIVNELRAAYTFSDYSRFPPADLATTNYTRDRFGLPSQTNFGYPYLYMGAPFPALGLTNGNPIGAFIEHQYQFSDDVTTTVGKHTITTGVDMRKLMVNAKATGLQDACCGQYNFNSTATNSGNSQTPGGTGGFTLASFLLGTPSGATLRGVVIPYYYRWKVAAAFLQDDYKIRSNLTFNLGLRWQYNSPRSEKYGRQATLDIDHPVPVNNAQGQVSSYVFNYLFSGFDGRSIYLEPVHKRNFEPRFGFAWTPKTRWTRGRTMVVRGGYGISHAPNTSRGRAPLPDLGASTSGIWNYTQWIGGGAAPRTQTKDPTSLVTLGRNPPVVIVDPHVLELPANGMLCSGCTPQDPRVPTSGLVAFASANKVPYVQTWSLTTQFELKHSLALTVGYLGQKGTHLYSPKINVNAPDQTQLDAMLSAGIDPNGSVPDAYGRYDAAGNLRTVQRVDLLRPNPTLADINVIGVTNGLSIYNAGTVSLDRRLHSGVGFRFNYTWSKSIDTNSDAGLDQLEFYVWGVGRVQNPLDLKANRSVSLFDSRHRLNLTVNWDLPFGKKKLLLASANRFVRALASDWQMNAVGSLYSGYPFSPNLGDANGVPSGVSGNMRVFPDIVPGVPLINPRWNKSVANDVPYFNPEAFARPAYGELGNAPRTLDWARNPWKPGMNASLFREFRPFENRRRYVQLRGEFFNVLNHTTFRTNSNNNLAIFTTGVPSSRTGLSLAGPVPYLVNATAKSYPAGSREAILAQYYVQDFAKLERLNNGTGRLIQLALKIYW